MDHHHPDPRSAFAAAAASPAMSLHRRHGRQPLTSSGRKSSSSSDDGNGTGARRKGTRDGRERPHHHHQSGRSGGGGGGGGGSSRNALGYILSGGQVEMTVGSVDRLYSYLSASDDDDEEDEEEEAEEEEMQRAFSVHRPHPHPHPSWADVRSSSIGPEDVSSLGWTRRRRREVSEAEDDDRDRGGTRPSTQIVNYHHDDDDDDDDARRKYGDGVYSGVVNNAGVALPMSVLSLSPHEGIDWGTPVVPQRNARSSSRLPRSSEIMNDSCYSKRPSHHVSPFGQNLTSGCNLEAVMGPVHLPRRTTSASSSSSASRRKTSHQYSRRCNHPAGSSGGGGAEERALCQNNGAAGASASTAAAAAADVLMNDACTLLASRLMTEESAGPATVWMQDGMPQQQQRMRTGEPSQRSTYHEQDRSSSAAFNDELAAMSPTIFIPIQHRSSARRYSSLSQATQRWKRHLRNRCSWKCTALSFITLAAALVALLACLIAMKVHNVSWKFRTNAILLVTEENGSNLSPATSNDVTTSSIVTTLMIDKEIVQRLTPRSYHRAQLYLSDRKSIKFNVSVSRTALLGFYGRRSARPSHVRYDFFFVFDGMKMESGGSRRKKRSSRRSLSNDGQDLSNSAFVHDFEAGLWYVFIFNDGDETQTISFTASILDTKTELSVCPARCNGRGNCANGACACFNGFTGSDCRQSVCPDLCQGNGAYSAGECSCYPGWKGKECHLSSTECDDPTCGGNGKCVGGFCVCAHGYTGHNCSEEMCLIECVHGKCVERRCHCNTGWTGMKCDNVSCDDRCALHGTCDNGSCICLPGWNGKHCSLDGCPQSCNDDHGDCRLMNSIWKCICREGWKGSSCKLTMEVDCDSGRDEDKDGLIDCLDPDCCASVSCKDSLQCRMSPNPLEILLRKQPPSGASSFYDRMKFLIDEQSVQSYATLSSFNPSQVSLIRGKVTLKDGGPLVSVRVIVVTQPLYGFTLTRDFGMFDILVNGGGSVTLSFQRLPFKVKQVTVNVPWNRIVTMDDVTLSLENNDEATEKTSCQSKTNHNFYDVKPRIVSPWRHTQLAGCPASTTFDPMSKTFQESLPIRGTDLYLVYHSGYASGYTSTMVLQLTPVNIPTELSIIYLTIVIEGAVVERVFEADPDLRYTFSWDRRNAYNQKVYGIVTATVSAGYQYKDCPYVFWVKTTGKMSGYSVSTSDIGGWNLNIHHAYNFKEGILQKGDGSIVYLKEQPRKAVTVVGDGTRRRLDCQSCDGPAHGSRLLAPVALASGRDGSLYVGDYNFIRKLSAAGNEVTSILQLDMPEIPYKYFMTVSPVDGKLYVSDHHGLRILRVKTMGAVRDLARNYEVVAGTGDQCLPGDPEKCGDDLAAVNARLNYPKGIAINKDGLMYVADGVSIRTINNAGIINTLIGSQDSPKYWRPLPCSTAVPANEVTLHWPTSIAVNPLDDSLNILDGGLVLKVTRENTVLIVAGRSPSCSHDKTHRNNNSNDDNNNNDNNPALKNPQHISFSPDGDLYVVESEGKDVRRVRLANADGRRTEPFVGVRSTCDRVLRGCDDNDDVSEEELFARLRLVDPTAATVTPDGALHITDVGDLKVHSVTPRLPSPNRQGHYEVPNVPTRELYLFNRYGQHIATRNLITDQYLYNFTYNVNSHYGKLLKVTDGGGNLVALRRDYRLQVKEMILPGGKKCLFTMDSMGQLQSFVNSDETATKFTYLSNSGLLESKESVNSGQIVLYRFSGSGQLSMVIQPTGDVKSCVDRTEFGDQTRLSYPQEGRFAIQHLSSQTAVTMETNLYPLATGEYGIATKRKILFLDNPVQTVEWRYYSLEEYAKRGIETTGGGLFVEAPPPWSIDQPDTNDQRLRYEGGGLFDGLDRGYPSYDGKELVVNGEVILTFKYGREDSILTVLNKKREEVMVVRYDNGGRPLQILPRSPVEGVNVTYNRLGQVTQWAYGDMHELRSYENISGNLVERRLANKATFKYVYRNNNKLTDVVLPSGKQYQFHYDDYGNLKTVVMPSQSKHHFNAQTFLGVYRLVYRPPDSRGVHVREYDGAGRLEMTACPSGHRRVSNRYDDRSRISRIFFDYTSVERRYRSDTDASESVAVNSSLPGLEYACTLTYRWNGSVVVAHSVSFDATEENELVDGEFLYTYNGSAAFQSESFQASFGRAKTTTTTTLQPVCFVYATDTGRLARMSPFAFDYPHAQREITTDGNVEIVRDFDRFGRQTDVWYRFNNYIVFTLEVKYDNVGCVHQWRRKVRTSDLKAYEYVYDTDGNLVEVLENSQSTWKYEYDANGNVVRIGYYSNVRSIVVRMRDQAESSGQDSYVYDDNGFLVRRNGEVFEYDSPGRMQRAFEPGRYDVRYFYDGLGRLFCRRDETKAAGAGASSSLQLYYADVTHADRATHVYDSSTKGVTQFYYDDRGKLFAMYRDGEYFYVGLDSNDSPILVMNSMGSVVKQMAYDPLGFQISDSAPDFRFVLGFRCGLADAATRLVFVGGVVYDPQLGRRVTPGYNSFLKTIHRLPLSPESANLYRFSFVRPAPADAGHENTDITRWLAKLGYNYARLVPGISLDGTIDRRPPEGDSDSDAASFDVRSMPVASIFKCAFDRDTTNFLESSLVPRSSLTTSVRETMTASGRSFSPLPALFGPGVVMSVDDDGRVALVVVDSADDALATLATAVFNGSDSVGLRFTVHGRDVRHFVRPSVAEANRLVKDLSLKADGTTMKGLNVTVHRIIHQQAQDVVKFVDVRVHDNHTVLNVRYGTTVEAERERVLRHAKQRAVDGAWEVERELIQSGKLRMNRWTRQEEEEVVAKGRLHGTTAEYFHDVGEFPELADCPKNVRFVPTVT